MRNPGLSRTVLQAYEWTRPVLFAGPAFLVLGIFLLWPLIWVIGMSFTSWNGYDSISWAGLNTWSSLLSDATFQDAVKNSLIWIGLSATIPVGLGFLLAVAFSRAGPVVGSAGRAISIVPLLLPPAVAAVTWGIVYNPNYGPLNATLGLVGLPQPDWLGDLHLAFWSLFVIVLWGSIGFSVLVFTAALRSIDRAYFDLARVEGARFLQQVRFILLPACRRSAALAMVVTVVITSQVFNLLLSLTSGSNGTDMLPFDMYNRAFGGGNVSQGTAEAALEVGMGVVLAALAFLVTSGHSGMTGEADFGVLPRSVMARVAAAVATVAFILPLLWDVMAAFTNGRAAVLRPLTVQWPPNLSAFAIAWNDGIGSGLWQSAAIGLIVVALTVGLALPAAFALSSRRITPVPSAAIGVILVVTLLQPGEPYLIPLFYLLQQLQLGNSIAGVVLAEVGRELPFAILLLWIALRGLPGDVMGSAELEAGWGFRLLARIALPLIAPAVIAAGLWVFVTSWSEYTLPTILLNNSTVQTAPMALQHFAGTYDTEFNLLAAGTLLLVAPVLLVLAMAYGPAGRGLRAVGKMVGS